MKPYTRRGQYSSPGRAVQRSSGPGLVSTKTRPASIVIRGQRLQPTAVFDTLWRWLVERKAIDTKRRSGMLEPCVRNRRKLSPTYSSFASLGGRRTRFCSSTGSATHRVLDRTSQFVVTEVIEQGSLDPTELLFRILLFNCFRIGTWKLLEEAFCRPLTYAGFDLDKYDKVLSAAANRGISLFTAAYMKIGHRLEHHANHMRHLELLEILMRDLPQILDTADYTADVYEQLAAYQGMGAFTAYQLMLSLSYSSLLNFSGDDFVVPGPGASSGLVKMFGRSTLRRAKTAVPEIESDILRWLVETQRAHFARLGLVFTYLRGPAGEEIDLGLADMEHAVCEVDKYARVVHPTVAGIGSRTQLRGRFQPSPEGLPAVAALPKAWADPARQTAKVRAGPVVVQPRYCILEILAERMAGDGAEYLVAWLGYTEATWEPRGLLLEDAPALVKEWTDHVSSLQ
ncbi:hypothetical protein B0H13DRAFT_902517 [Mycena leptocephala]|nr:hypothetical protein B0H13DRAFT_902517 [Mycena leptocephala]